MQFNVEGETETTGFSNVTIPKDLLNAEDNWAVLVEGVSVTPTVNEDETSTYIYFTYSHSSKTVEIIGTTAIPEFPFWTLLLIALVAVVAITFVYKHKMKKKEAIR